jgi:hypothetical protein
MGGETPARRIQACFVGMEGYGVLIGGRKAEEDNRVYFLDVKNRRWISKGSTPNDVMGASCARHSSDIYVHGGMTVIEQSRPEL